MYAETADSLDSRIHRAATEKCRSDQEEASFEELLARARATEKLEEILQRPLEPADLGPAREVCLGRPFVYEPILAGRRFQIEVQGAQQNVTVKIRNHIAVAEVHSLADFPAAEQRLRSNTLQILGFGGFVLLLFLLMFAVPLVVHFTS